ncbi:MAG: ArsR family transcriptional regulator [Steroidobacteraceae bacterium]
MLGVSQPKISRHLAYLRRAGIVAARRDGKWMHYRLSMPKDEASAAILQETVKHLGVRPEMQRDIARLSSACCKPERFDLLQGAPQPQAIGQSLTPS